MKPLLPSAHIFVLHSHICYLTSIAVIQHLGLQVQDVIFLLDRGYSPPLSSAYAASEYKLCTVNNTIFSSRSIADRWNDYFSAQRSVDNITSSLSSFKAYVSNCYFLTFFLLCRHPKCVGYSLLEEGMPSFCHSKSVVKNMIPSSSTVNKVVRDAKRPRITLSRIQKSFMFRVRHLLLFVSYLILFIHSQGKLPGFSRKHLFYLDDYVAAYHLHPLAFESFDRNVILQWPSLPNAFSTKIPDGSFIIALDPGIEFGYYDESTFILVWTAVFRKLQNMGVEKVYVKSHPYHESSHHKLEASRSLFNQIASEIVSIHWLDSDVILESLPSEFKYNLITCSSSVALYFGFLNPNNQTFVLYRELLSPSSLVLSRLPSFL